MDFETKDEYAIHQPHDKIVKKLLSNPQAAKDILSFYLPKEILDIVNLDQLELQRDSFIDDEHRMNAVDLLYKTQFNEAEGYIYILIEHQRKSDYWMPLRLFKYIGIIWDHIRASNTSKHLPLIYPTVIYNGEKPYSHSLNLIDLIEPESSKAIFRHLFTTPFNLIDLPSVPDEELRKEAQDRVKGIALLMTLKHVNDRHLQSFLNRILIGILQQLDQLGDTDAVIDILYYLLNTNRFLDEELFWTNLNHKFSEKTEKTMPTIAQKIEARGEAKGEARGEARGEIRGEARGYKKGVEEMEKKLAAIAEKFGSEGFIKGINESINQGKNLGIEAVAKNMLSNITDLPEPDLIHFVQRMTGLSVERIRELQNFK